MAIEIVSFPSYKMMIFHSYVSLPEGNLEVSNMGVPAVIIHSQMDCPSELNKPSSELLG